jgi:hypothetical protein
VNDEPKEPVPGLTRTRATSLERFPVRTREGSATLSAWRLPVECAEGAGAIVLAEVPPDSTFYRGEGVFLGWPQERLKAAYLALLPKTVGDGFEMQQMG